jgi:hypothetical protein
MKPSNKSTVPAQPKWKKIGPRSYTYSANDVQAFVFGATRPDCLWAWSVYWKNGHQAWAEHGFRRAKQRAGHCISDLREKTGDSE